MYVYIRDAQSSLLRTRCVAAPLAPRSDCLLPFPFPLAESLCPSTDWGCTLAMFIPLRKLRSSFEEKWNKFKYIFSAFRIKQKERERDASQRAAANCRSSRHQFHPSPHLLLLLLPCSCSCCALLCSFAKPWASLFIFRPFAILAVAAFSLPFIVVVFPQLPRLPRIRLPLPLSLFTYLLLRFIILH